MSVFSTTASLFYFGLAEIKLAIIIQNKLKTLQLLLHPDSP